MDSRTLIEAYKEAGFAVISTAGVTWLLDERRVALSVPTLEDVYTAVNEVRQRYGPLTKW